MSYYEDKLKNASNEELIQVANNATPQEFKDAFFNFITSESVNTCNFSELINGVGIEDILNVYRKKLDQCGFKCRQNYRTDFTEMWSMEINKWNFTLSLKYRAIRPFDNSKDTLIHQVILHGMSNVAETVFYTGNLHDLYNRVISELYIPVKKRNIEDIRETFNF